MKYLVDTDWVISFLNGRPEAIGLFDRLASDGIAVSVVAWGEVYEGVIGSPDRRREFDEFSTRIDVLLVNIAVARRYAETRFYLRASGSLIPDNDLWIAATALAHDLAVVSQDEHFRRVPGLRIYQLS